MNEKKDYTKEAVGSARKLKKRDIYAFGYVGGVRILDSPSGRWQVVSFLFLSLGKGGGRV